MNYPKLAEARKEKDYVASAVAEDYFRKLEDELRYAEGMRDEALEQVNAVETIMVDLRGQLEKLKTMVYGNPCEHGFVSKCETTADCKGGTGGLYRELAAAKDKLVAEEHACAAWKSSAEGCGKRIVKYQEREALLADLLAAVDAWCPVEVVKQAADALREVK